MSRTVKALTVILAGILTLLIAVPWLVPLASFIPSVEARASAALGQPVKVSGLRLSLLPLEITASQVSSPLIQVGRITARPSWLHLFSDIRVVNEIELEHVRVRQRVLPPGCCQARILGRARRARASHRPQGRGDPLRRARPCASLHGS